MCSYRGEVAIHASATYKASDFQATCDDMLRRRLVGERHMPQPSGGELPSASEGPMLRAPRGYIVGRAVVVGRIELHEDGRRPLIVIDIEPDDVPPWARKLKAMATVSEAPQGGRRGSERVDGPRVSTLGIYVTRAQTNELLKLAQRLDLRWWDGGHGLILDSVQRCEPVRCKGQLGIWQTHSENSDRAEECVWQTD